MCRFTFWTYEDVVLDAYVRESESGFRLAVRALLVALHTSQLIQQLLSCTLTHPLHSLKFKFLKFCLKVSRDLEIEREMDGWIEKKDSRLSGVRC